MRRHTVRTAVTLCAATLLAAMAGTASAAPAAPQADRAARQPDRRPVLVTCQWKPQQRPDAFILACGDGNSRLAALHWNRWGSQSATARGLNYVNDCKPYCAAGTFRSYPVIVRLDRARPWAKDPALRHYTRLSLVFTDGRPEGYQHVVNYQLWN
ncbi:hypothetical protein [Streptomyces tropicalis]|uniref:Secreted protein n=1 Tax=Streptomyces tropicalis TaxID=3034234 RepID=A0ABT6A3E8_9ACTN|nr:hypothetical protein [Streptomyces tropicalis]MDF3299168.1 hypothetical protein [Streptomyces tropicalis]